MICPKAAPSRMDRVSYENLRQQILRRDGWRCQSCGTMSNLEVHHREFRSHSGSDLVLQDVAQGQFGFGDLELKKDIPVVSCIAVVVY